LIVLNISRFSGPSGAGYGSDFAVFYEAAKVQASGSNPYNDALLWQRERADFAAAGLQLPHDRALVRVGNPPLFFWVLRPLAALPFRAAGVLWTAAMYLLSVVGFVVLLRFLGWRRWALVSGIFLATPQVVLGAFYGDLIGIIFAAICVSLAVGRRYPGPAGTLLSVAWLKPHIALPAVLLICLFHTQDWRRLALGFSAASVLLAAAMFGLVGSQGIHEWIVGLTGWTHSIKGQPEIASAAGLYYLWSPPVLRTILSMLLVVGALAATLATRHRLRSRLPDPLAVAWLWALWLVCAPYAHINDGMVLAFPVLVLLGRNGSRSLQLPSLLVIYLLISCIVLNSVPGVPVNFEALKLSAVGVILAVVAARTSLNVLPGPSSLGGVVGAVRPALVRNRQPAP
jgi:hypothetical protein